MPFVDKKGAMKLLKEIVKNREIVCGIASEEEDDFITIE